MPLRPDSLVIRNSVNTRMAEQKATFITSLERTATVAVAARATGLSITNLYKWRNEDPDFKEAWDNAITYAFEALESAAYLKVAHVLTDENKRISMPEAKLIEMFLSGAKPEKYKQTPIAVDNSINFNNTLNWADVPDELVTAFNAGQITLQDVYDRTLQLKEQEGSTAGEDRRDEGSGAT